MLHLTHNICQLAFQTYIHLIVWGYPSIPAQNFNRICKLAPGFKSTSPTTGNSANHRSHRCPSPSQREGAGSIPIWKPLKSSCRPGSYVDFKGPEALPAAFLSARWLLYLHLAHFMPFQACTHTLFLSCSYPVEAGGRKQKWGSRKERDPLPSPTAHRFLTQAALPREWKLGVFYLSSLILKLEHNVFKMVTH